MRKFSQAAGWSAKKILNKITTTTLIIAMAIMFTAACSDADNSANAPVKGGGDNFAESTEFTEFINDIVNGSIISIEYDIPLDEYSKANIYNCFGYEALGSFMRYTLIEELTKDNEVWFDVEHGGIGIVGNEHRTPGHFTRIMVKKDDKLNGLLIWLYETPYKPGERPAKDAVWYCNRDPELLVERDGAIQVYVSDWIDDKFGEFNILAATHLPERYENVKITRK